MSGPPAGVRTVSLADGEATTLFLVRHGEARCNVAGIVGGISGCTGLTEEGVEQAESLRRRLAETAELGAAVSLYSSVLLRARQTAEIIRPFVGDGSLEVTEQCDLCELHPGEADGLTWPEFSARYGEPDWDADPSVEVAPGGESWTSFVARAGGALRLLADRHAGGLVVVVCHAGVIESALLDLLALSSVRPRLGLRTSHASMSELDLSGGQWRLLRYNDAAHVLLDRYSDREQSLRVPG